MKYSLYCTLFGHIWVKKWYQDSTGLGDLSRGFTEHFSENVDNCVNCGLSKKEVGLSD